MVGCGFILCWTPFLVLMLTYVYIVAGKINVHGFFYQACMALAFTNSTINPFIYAAKYREFQQGVRRLISKVKKDQHSNQQS